VGINKLEQVELKLKMGKTEYLPGQPAVAYLQLTNRGSEPISLIDQLSPEYEVVKFYIRKDTNQEIQFIPYTLVDSLAHSISISPGDSIRASAKIFFGSGGYTFPKPGKYQIKATYNGIVDEPTSVINSNIAEIRITAPANDEERDQVNLVMGDEQGLFLLFEGGDHLSSGRQKLKELTEKYPRSVLAGYAHTALGVNLSEDFANFKENKVRKADVKQSVSHLESAKDKVTGHWANKAYLTLAKLQQKTAPDKDAARTTLNEFIHRFSDESKNANSVKRAKNMLLSL
jgi:hypothetical protein